jgi:HAD superfamily hydrolase (TIGR01549 family)
MLFDCGETLWTRNDKLVCHALEQVANWRALALLYAQSGSQTIQITGEQLRSAVETRVRQLRNVTPEHEPDFALATLEALRQLGFSLVDYDLGASIFEALRVRYHEARCLFDDTHSTLAALRKRGFLLGIVTNRAYGGQAFTEDLSAFGLLKYMEYPQVAVSADLRMRKPNPEIFLHTLRALNVPPEEGVMVGDSLRADVCGAQQLNMFAVWKPKMRLRAEARSSLPEGVQRLDNDYLLQYAQRLDSKKEHWSGPLIPDLIIEHLSELLDVFLKAGKQ